MVAHCLNDGFRTKRDLQTLLHISANTPPPARRTSIAAIVEVFLLRVSDRPTVVLISNLLRGMAILQFRVTKQQLRGSRASCV
jgi:hypothetical protein